MAAIELRKSLGTISGRPEHPTDQALTRSEAAARTLTPEASAFVRGAPWREAGARGRETAAASETGRGQLAEKLVTVR